VELVATREQLGEARATNRQLEESARAALQTSSALLASAGGLSESVQVRWPLRPFWRLFSLRFTYVTSILVKKH
jgi:hypothetical protein